MQNKLKVIFDPQNPQPVLIARKAIEKIIPGLKGRTLKKWEDDGLLPKPYMLNGRAYHEVDRIVSLIRDQGK